MNPNKEYSMVSKIYINGKKSNILWIIVKIVFILYFLIALFKIVMEGGLNSGRILGNIIVPLIILAAAYGSENKRDGYQPIGLTLRFFQNRLQVIYGAKDYYDGNGVCSRVFEIRYSDIRELEYSIPLVCVRLTGQYSMSEYKDEIMANNGMPLRMLHLNHELFLYLEREQAETIVMDLAEFSGKNVRYLN